MNIKHLCARFPIAIFVVWCFLIGTQAMGADTPVDIGSGSTTANPPGNITAYTLQGLDNNTRTSPSANFVEVRANAGGVVIPTPAGNDLQIQDTNNGAVADWHLKTKSRTGGIVDIQIDDITTNSNGVEVGAIVPSTCTPGRRTFIKTNALAGDRVWECVANNTMIAIDYPHGPLIEAGEMANTLRFASGQELDCNTNGCTFRLPISDAAPAIAGAIKINATSKALNWYDGTTLQTAATILTAALLNGANVFSAQQTYSAATLFMGTNVFTIGATSLGGTIQLGQAASAQALTDGTTTITASASGLNPLKRITSTTSGQVLMTAAPTITTASISVGTWMILRNTDATATDCIVLQDKSVLVNSALVLSEPRRTLCPGSPPMELIFDGADWREIGDDHSERIWFPAARCAENATVATSLFDTALTGSPAAACISGTNTYKGVLDFDPDADEAVQKTLMLPPKWMGGVDVTFKWQAVATAGTTAWCLQLVCVADGETDDPAFPAQGTGNCVSDTAKGVANQTNDATIVNVTSSGCAAGELMHMRISRDANASAVTDSMTGDARLLGMEVTLR